MIDGAGIAYLRMESLASMEQDVFGVLSYGKLHIDSIELHLSLINKIYKNVHLTKCGDIPTHVLFIKLL